ncbi:hypothetical protein ACFOJ6_18065 [Gordonia humi]|uniref:hypothetical protein n=1 Tax=Gordonia humi TaxID=686429 RepID=UPI0036142EA5
MSALLEVEQHRIAGRRVPDGHTQTIGAAASGPLRRRFERADVPDTEQSADPRIGGGQRHVEVGQRTERRGPVPRQASGDRLGVGERTPVGDGELLGSRLRARRQRGAVDDQRQAAPGGQRVGRRTEFEDGHTVETCADGQFLLAGHLAVAEKEHQMAQTGRRFGPREAPPVREVFGEIVLGGAQRAIEHAGRPETVHAIGMPDVRQPFEPVPLRCDRIGRDDGDPEVVRSVLHGEPGQYRADQRVDVVVRPGQADRGESAQCDGRRQVRDRGTRLDESSQGHRGHGFDGLDGRCLR